MQTKKLAGLAIALALSVTTVAAMAQVTVGGAPMYASKDIIDNAVNSKTTLRWSQRSKQRGWSIR